MSKSFSSHQATIIALSIYAISVLIAHYIGSINSINQPRHETSSVKLASSSSIPPATALPWWAGTPEVDFDIEGDFDGSGIRAACDATDWVEGRTVICDNIEGGMGNVRNAVLVCLRYSIVVGSAFVMPSLRLRGAIIPGVDNLHSGGRAGLEFLFDEAFFLQSMKRFCPQMSIYDRLESVPNYKKAVLPEPFHPKDIYTWATGQPSNPGLINGHADSFRKDFDFVMGNKVPAIYRLAWPFYFEWQVLNDPTPFRVHFGRLLKFRPDVLQLASQTYLALRSFGPTYYGVHVRAEGDVRGNSDWTKVADQMAAYVAWCSASGHRLMYAAGGDTSSIQQLVNLAASKGILVVNKHSLLPRLSLVALTAMPFDRQALVDYLVLLKCDIFSGVGMSSFAANIAIRRHSLSNIEDIYSLGGDEYSRLLDVAWAGNFVQTVWP